MADTVLDNSQLMDQTQAVTLMPQNYREVKGVAQAFVASRMFNGVASDSQAFTKILAGMELGIAPFAAMRAVHVIQGQATLSANVMAAMVKRSGRYDYRVRVKTKDKCEIEFFEMQDGKRESVGVESFDVEEATAAKLVVKDNWKSYPKSMMFARCMSNGVRTYCPDVFNGMSVYTPDELGSRVNSDGEVIDVEEAVRDESTSGKPDDQEIVDASAADVDQMGTGTQEPTKSSRADTKRAVEAVEAEVNAEYEEPTTQLDAQTVLNDMSEPEEKAPAPSRHLDPRKSQKIYKLGAALGYAKPELIEQVDALTSNQEADDLIAALEDEKAMKDSGDGQ